MVVFVANRTNLQSKRLHDRIQARLNDAFEAVRRRRADPQEPGPYRVVGDVNPRQFLEDMAYPATSARLEIGFHLQTDEPREYYWVNWIEPERGLLVGWHQDETHDELGPVHLQVNDGETTVVRQPAEFIDAHPLAVVERRYNALRDVVLAVEWGKDRPVGLAADPAN